MAGFITTYQQIQTLNIKHIYSEQRNMLPRRQPRRNRIVDVREQAKIERRKRLFHSDRRCCDYYPQLGVRLPRAPAFHDIPREDIEAMVKRLSRPKSSYSPSYQQRRLLERPEDATCHFRRCQSAGNEYPPLRLRPESRSSEDVEKISARLHESQTHMSRIRSAQSSRGS